MRALVSHALLLLAGLATSVNAWEEEYRGCIKACSFRMPGEKWDDAKRDWAKACRESCEDKLPPEVRAQRAQRMEKAKAAQAKRSGEKAPPLGASGRTAGAGSAASAATPHKSEGAPARSSPVKIPANVFKGSPTPKPAAEGSKDWTRHHLECIKACMPERRMGEVWDAPKKAVAKACQESCSNRIPEHVRQQRAQKMKEAGVAQAAARPAAPAVAVGAARAQPSPWSSHKVSQDSASWKKRHLECIRACMPESRKGEVWGESERAQAKLCRESCSEQLPEEAKAHKAPKPTGSAPARNPWASSGRAGWMREHQDCIKACLPVARAGEALDAAKRAQAKACQEACNEKVPEDQRAKAKKMRQDPRFARQMQDSLRKSTHRFMENMALADGQPSAANATGAKGPPAAWVKKHSECVNACMPAKEKGTLWDEGEKAQAKVCRDNCEQFIPEEVKAERQKRLSETAEEVTSMEL